MNIGIVLCLQIAAAATARARARAWSGGTASAYFRQAPSFRQKTSANLMPIWRVIGIWRKIDADLIDLGATMKPLPAAVLLLGVLSGCVQDPPRNLEAEWAVDKQIYDRSLAGWIGASESALVDSCGAPDRIYTLDNSKYVMYRLPRYRLCEQTFKITKGVVEHYNYNVRGCYIRPSTYYYY